MILAVRKENRFVDKKILYKMISGVPIKGQ